MTDFTDAEQAAIDTWNRGSADSTQMLLAVRAAARVVEQRYERSEDHHLMFLMEELAAIRDLAFRGGGSPSDALEAIQKRARRAIEEASR